MRYAGDTARRGESFQRRQRRGEGRRAIPHIGRLICSRSENHPSVGSVLPTVAPLDREVANANELAKWAVDLGSSWNQSTENSRACQSPPFRRICAGEKYSQPPTSSYDIRISRRKEDVGHLSSAKRRRPLPSPTLLPSFAEPVVLEEGRYLFSFLVSICLLIRCIWVHFGFCEHITSTPSK